MSVLNVERPDFMSEEEITMFESSVVKFFQQSAPAERVDKWRKDKVVERAMWTEAAEAGLGTFLFQMALISVNLGLMNLLPIPVLDGGHSVTALLEAVTRRRLPLRVRTVLTLAVWMDVRLGK